MNKSKLARFIKPIALILSAVMLIVLLPGGVISSDAAVSSASISKLEEQIKKNEQDQANLKTAIANANAAIDSTLQTKAYLDTQINLKTEKITLTEQLIEEYERQIADKKTEIAEKESAINKKYESFRDQLRLSYENGDVNYFELLFSSESLIQFLVNAERMLNLLDYETTVLGELDRQAEDLNTLKTQLESYLTEANDLKDELIGDKADLEQSSYEALQYIKTKQSTIVSSESELKALAAANSALDAQLEEQLKELAAQSQNIYIGGEFIWPLDRTWRNISTGYEWRTLYGVTEFHRGIDIPANAGSNIYASNGGTVVTATLHSSYGNYIVIDHGGGKATLYAHCSKLLVKVGDVVSQGDVIALVGTTGYSTGNHLHFEVRINGATDNPFNYVSRP